MNQRRFVNIVLVIAIVVIVAVGGYFVFVKKSGSVAQQPTPTPASDTQTSTPTPTDLMANWRTYRNEEFGFEVKYQENWLTFLDYNKNYDFSVAFLKKNPDSKYDPIFKLGIFINPLRVNFGEYLNQTLVSSKILTHRKTGSTSISGKSAVTAEYCGEPGCNQEVYIQQNNFVYLITGAFDLDSKILDQILSTFKFTK